MSYQSKRIVFICVTLGLGILLLAKSVTYMAQNTKPSHVTKNDITCSPEDRHDTEFIRSLKKMDEIIIPNSKNLNQLSREELAYIYHRYIENIQYMCKRRIRLGSLDDGGWDICDEEKFRPPRNASSCLVYSFGINNDFTFDDAVVEHYGCDVHCFDPSMDTDDFDKDKIHFHNLGISSRDETTSDNWKLLRYNSIRSQLGQTKEVISILKMDIEMYEWSVLSDILSTADITGTNNLVMEFHLELSSPEQNRLKYLNALNILNQIYGAGYRIFWTHQNLNCQFLSECKKELRTNCHEVNFVKIR